MPVSNAHVRRAFVHILSDLMSLHDRQRHSLALAYEVHY